MESLPDTNVRRNQPDGFEPIKNLQGASSWNPENGYFYPKMVAEIVCSYVLILGLLQIPIRAALYKIRTIDAMDDDLIG